MIPFHRLLITSAILFCSGFTLWALARYVVLQQPWMLALGLTFAAFAAALSYYLAHLKRFLGR